MLEKEELKDVLVLVSERAHSEKITELIKQATLDLNARKLMQIMIDLHREVLEEMGFDGVDGLLDCMEAIDKYMSDNEIMKLVTDIRKKFGQE